MPKRRRASSSPTLGTLLLLVMAGVAMVPAAAQAPQAFGASPPTIDVTGAQSQQRYVRVVQVQNQLDSSSTITIEAQGLTGSWTTTDPPTGFTMPARTNRAVNLTISVPDGAQGPNTGSLRFLTEQKGSPSGSGAGIRYAVTVRINVTLDGAPQTRIAWLDSQAPNVEAGSPPRAETRVRNEGNVRTTARAQASVLAFDHDEVLANATGEATLDPGAEAAIGFTADRPLPVGQYRLRIRSLEPAGHESILTFKVYATGLVPPDGQLRGLIHASRATQDAPVRIDGLFENTGNVTIQRAKLTGEVRRGSTLVATFSSDEVLVPPGETRNLTAYWTPTEDGEFQFVGHVNYDGYLTPTKESLVNIASSPSEGPPLWILGLVLLLLVGIAGVVWWRSRR